MIRQQQGYFQKINHLPAKAKNSDSRQNSARWPIAAIRAVTVNAADLLGVAGRGLLKAGLLADIIAVPGNPLQNVRVLENVQFVMKGGRVYKQSEEPASSN